MSIAGPRNKGESDVHIPKGGLNTSTDGQPFIPGKGYSCEFCGKNYWNKSDCEGHKFSQHLQIKPFSCTACDMSFSYKQSLRRHENSCLLKQHQSSLFSWGQMTCHWKDFLVFKKRRKIWVWLCWLFASFLVSSAYKMQPTVKKVLLQNKFHIKE